LNELKFKQADRTLIGSKWLKKGSLSPNLSSLSIFHSAISLLLYYCLFQMLIFHKSKLNTMKGYTSVFALSLIFSAPLCAQNKSDYQIITSYPILSGGGYDYMTVDQASDKLYVSHGSQVNVLNKTNGDSIGVIKTEKDVHGIALVHTLGKGYVSNGSMNRVLVFDLATNKTLKYVPTGKFADAIFYDDFSNKIISCNGMSKNMTFIDPVADTVVATVQLTGWPETAVSDGKGNIFVNNAEKGEMDVVNATTFKIIHTWPNKPGTGASGLAIDKESMRLFATCENKLMIVMDATNGKVISSFPTGDGADGAGFDNQMKTAYSSNGEGTLTVIKEKSPNEFILVGNVETKPGARTITVDQTTHKIYLPSGSFKPAAKGSFRPELIAGSFKILVVQSK
jgi:DNA-binding beta-propeller fold protein YncE